MSATLIIGQCVDAAPSAALSACVGAAAIIGYDVYILAFNDEDAQACAAIDGVSRVYVADSGSMLYPIAERVCAAAAGAVKHAAGDICRVIAPADTFGKDVLPRLAAMLDTDMISDVIEIITPHHVRRPCFAGNIISDIIIDSSAVMVPMTVRPSAFTKAPSTGGSADIVAVTCVDTGSAIPEYIETITPDTDLPDPLTAKRVISGGRGTGSKEGFDMIYRFAASLGDCAVGASRAAVDAGYASNDMQIGQTGKIVAPELYIAAGISGAIQHQAGIKDSGVIVAINTDENAPIFDIADIGLVADIFEAIPALESAIKDGGA